MKKQRLEKNLTDRLKQQQYVCVHQCVSSVLIGWLVCWDAAAMVFLWFLIGRLVFFFFKKAPSSSSSSAHFKNRLLFLLHQPNPHVFAQPRLSPTDRQTRRQVVCLLSFILIQIQVFPQSSSRCVETEEYGLKERQKSDWVVERKIQWCRVQVVKYIGHKTCLLADPLLLWFPWRC